MIVIIDSNIMFSASISPNGKIAELILSPTSKIQRVSCYYALVELFKHQPKIIQLSKQPIDKVVSTLYSLLQKIDFTNESIIEPTYWKEADLLTSGVDSFDISYVALTLKMGGWLWTGDKKLTTHLKNMGFDRVISTSELYDIVF